MEPISQLDVQNPDHISVITRDGKVTISVTKEGASVTLGFPIRNALDTTPRFPLQQPSPVVVKCQETFNGSSGNALNSTKSQLPFESLQDPKRNKELGMRFKAKLTEQQVIEMKQILADPEIMSKFSSKTNAYAQLGQMYGVSSCRVQQIANGKGWTHIKV
jgi:hypothetical protein